MPVINEDNRIAEQAMNGSYTLGVSEYSKPKKNLVCIYLSMGGAAQKKLTGFAPEMQEDLEMYNKAGEDAGKWVGKDTISLIPLEGEDDSGEKFKYWGINGGKIHFYNPKRRFTIGESLPDDW